MANPASVHVSLGRRSSGSSRVIKSDSVNVTELSFDFDTRFSEIPCASMKLLSAFALFSTIVLAAPDSRKPAVSDKKPAVSEESVAPTAFEGRAKPKPQLISSDLNGRDLQFITSTVDLRDTLVFLAGKTGESGNSNLQAMGKELQKNLPSQTAVLSTLAEMRNVVVPATSSRQQRLEKKLAAAKGARFEKALLDALLETNQELVTACEAGLRSSDKTVQQFAEQTLPYAKGTLARVQAMAGIAPRRSEESSVPPPIATGPQPAKAAPKPGFRANIPAAETAN